MKAGPKRSGQVVHCKLLSYDKGLLACLGDSPQDMNVGLTLVHRLRR